MTTDTGFVLNVSVEELGSELVSAVIIGATSLTLLDAADFSEDGGTILIGDDTTELVGYSALDDDTGIMTLATPLVAAYAANVRVRKYPLSVEKKADVQIDGEGEAVECVVPVALYDRLDEGTRDDATAEQVLIDKPDDSDTYTVVDILGMEPLVDGAFINPESTVPPPALSDGAPPAQAPTGVTAGAFAIRAGRVSWTPPANPDPMHYRVYVKNATGVTTADEVAADTFSLAADVLKYAGQPLDPDVTYYVKVAAVDADGEGPLSTEASFQPRQADNADLSADEVFAIKIEVAGIQSGVAASDIFVGASFAVADYDVDTGLPIPGTERFLLSGDGSTRWFDSTGVERVTFDPNTASYVFRGDVEADHLTVTQGSIQGGANELAEGAVLTLQRGVTTPKNPPSVVVEYDTLQMDVIPLSGLALDGSGDWMSAITQAPSNPAVIVQDSVTGLLLNTLSGAPAGYTRTAGVIRVDATHVYVLAFHAGSWHVLRFTEAGGFQDISTWPHADGSRLPAIGYDSVAGEILIAQSRAVDDKVRVRRYTYNAGGTLTSSVTAPVDSAAAFANDLAYIAYGSFDLGHARYLYHAADTGLFRSMDTSGVRDTGDEFPASASVLGAHWNGTNFYSLDASGVLRKYEAGAGNRWTTATDESWYAAYTWYRATGTLETLRSPYTAFTMLKRAKVTIQTAPLPTGSATPPSEARVYLKKGTTNPGTNPATQNMTRQASTTGAPPKLTVVNADFSVNNNPTVSGFGAAGTSALINDADGNMISSADSAWTAYTPTFSAATSGGLLNNGTLTGRWRRIGKVAEFAIKMVVGSTTNFGTGGSRWSLPAAALDSADTAVGSAIFNDVSGTKMGGFTVGIGSATTVGAWGAGGAIGPTSPVTPATGDIITLCGTYELA